MNQTLNDLKTRRSIRKYKTDPIPKELLDQVLEAGTYAPTGMNLLAHRLDSMIRRYLLKCRRSGQS